MARLPQLNIRLPTEHHDMIRELAQRLRADPSLAVGLESLLAQARKGAAQAGVIGSSPDNPIALGLADEVADLRERSALLPEILERLAQAEEFARRIMAFAESINEGIVKDREARAATLSDPASPVAIPGDSPTRGKPAKAKAAVGSGKRDRGKTGKGGRRPPRPWTEEDNATLRRIIERGGTQAEAAREMDRSDGTISERWRKLLERENVT